MLLASWPLSSSSTSSLCAPSLARYLRARLYLPLARERGGNRVKHKHTHSKRQRERRRYSLLRPLSRADKREEAAPPPLRYLSPTLFLPLSLYVVLRSFCPSLASLLLSHLATFRVSRTKTHRALKHWPLCFFLSRLFVPSSSALPFFSLSFSFSHAHQTSRSVNAESARGRAHECTHVDDDVEDVSQGYRT